MAHFAQIDYENKILQVLVVRNEDILDQDGHENEQVGIEFLKSIFGPTTRWVQTSYNNNFRHRYAGVGMVYNTEHDVFLYPQPYPSWVLNTETYEWDPPAPQPELTQEQRDSAKYYEWDEDIKEWVLKTSDDVV